MLYSEVEDSLSHIGVKGMKWGHRKAEGINSAATKAKASKIKMSGREKRAAATKFYHDRALQTIDQAAKNPDDLIGVSSIYGQHIVTGKEFTSFLAQGGAFNMKYTDVYASLNSDKTAYIMNEKFTQSYKQASKVTK
ncbi:MAG TPA: hypothetical protein PK599_05985 [bacterium]|nr:hypothetical protein [bacterium]